MPSGVPIILDCDPGHDDAIAIITAAHHADLVGVTTVAGNAPLESTTRNACVLRDLITAGGGHDFPIHAGAERPLVAPQRPASNVHGTSGLDGADLPEPSGRADSSDAVGYIVDTCRARSGTWIVAVGPLTNVALAIRSAPDLVEHIAGISLMGGGTFGNRTATGEFNIWADPEAAAIVFESRARLVMAGLDVTHQFQATPERIAAVGQLPGRLAAALADLLTFFSARYVERHDALSGAAVHDPLAVLAITHRELFTSTPRHVAIETAGLHTRGMTVIDQRSLKDRPAPNVDVLTAVDADAAWTHVVAAIAAASR
jgi:inosine-uridine nucleoside N-ribohydrolase